MSVMRGGADQLGDAHRAAAADEDAARALGQRIEGGAVGHADVAGAGQLEPAADHRAVQRRDHRHRAVLHAGRARRATCANGAGPGRRRAPSVRTGRGRRRSAGPRRRSPPRAPCEGRFSKVSRRARIRASDSALRLARALQADDGDVVAELELEVGVGHGCIPGYDRLWL